MFQSFDGTHVLLACSRQNGYRTVARMDIEVSQPQWQVFNLGNAVDSSTTLAVLVDRR